VTGEPPSGETPHTEPGANDDKIDLNVASPEGAPRVAARAAVVPPPSTPVTPEQQRESMRGVLASLLTGILGVVVIGTIVLVAYGRLTIGNLKTISQVLLTPLVAIVGTVVGFYFGGQTAKEDQGNGGRLTPGPSRPSFRGLLGRAKDKRGAK
jgi:hypothetical protein